jgi:hypothetical protein
MSCMAPPDLFRRCGFRILALAAILVCSSIVAPNLLLAQGNVGPPSPLGPPAPPVPSIGPRPLGPLPAHDAPGPAPPAAGAAPVTGKGNSGIGGALGGAITGAILGALIGLLLWALRRTAKAPIKVDPATGGAVVEFSPGLRMLVLGLSLFTPTVILIVAAFLPAENSGVYVAAVVASLLFTALGGAVCWGLFKARIIATSDGLIVESGWKRRHSLPWRDVVEVVRDQRSGGLLFRGPSTKSDVCISPLMAGLKPLVAVMRQHLPADRYAKASDLLARVDRLEGGNAMPFLGVLDKKTAS